MASLASRASLSSLASLSSRVSLSSLASLLSRVSQERQDSSDTPDSEDSQDTQDSQDTLDSRYLLGFEQMGLDLLLIHDGIESAARNVGRGDRGFDMRDAVGRDSQPFCSPVFSRTIAYRADLT